MERQESKGRGRERGSEGREGLMLVENKTSFIKSQRTMECGIIDVLKRACERAEEKVSLQSL